MRMLIHGLLGLLLCFAFFSASAATSMGLQSLRMLTFLALLGALVVITVVVAPRLPVQHEPFPLVLLALLGVLGLQSLTSPFDLIEYKLALPVIALMAAPRIAALLGCLEITRTVWLVLSGYVALTAVTSVVSGAEALARGHDSIERWDATGSVIAHGNLCAIYVLLACAVLRVGRGSSGRWLLPGLAVAALIMAFLSGTRTVLVIWLLYAVLCSMAVPSERKHLIAIGFGLLTALALHTLLVDGSLAQRLLGTGDDYSSGRWDSIMLWLSRVAEHPFGLGLGAVRSLLASGRPAIDGERLLEWPHNEFVRLLVEGGPAGLLFALGLAVHILRRAVRGLQFSDDPVQRSLLLALTADVVAEMMLQNFLNGVYQATMFILLIGALSARPPASTMAEPTFPR
jgi:hypothetical protein